jgi:hypothetical protein
MVAMHGREDPLLETARFPRLLRQANDAEVADVRKLGDDEYEISAQRTPGRPQQQPLPSRDEMPAPMPEVAPETASAAEPATGPRENGQRFGVRFRRGSRGPLRPGEIPLIGVVQMDASAEAEPLMETAPAEPAQEEKRPRARRPRKKAAAAPAGSEPEGGDPAPPKGRRPRARKKPG